MKRNHSITSLSIAAALLLGGCAHDMATPDR
jgi:PBP1b-binding outer membrane lipoprotein LpoB